LSSFFQGAYWGHSKVAAPGMLSTTGRTLAIGNCKDGSLRSVLTWDVGPGLAPAQAVPSCGRGGPTFKLGHYCSLGNPGVYLHDPAVWSPSIASPAGRRYVHVPLARISHHGGEGGARRAAPRSLLYKLRGARHEQRVGSRFFGGPAFPTSWRKTAERFERSGLAIHRSPHALSWKGVSQSSEIPTQHSFRVPSSDHNRD
jgi:hypothetical protein